jgi:heat shock protein HslJ
MRRVSGLLGVAIVLVLAAGLGGCRWRDDVDSRTATAGLPQTEEFLEAHDWVLRPAVSSPSVEGGEQVTLSFDDGHLSGQGPCNLYRASYDLDAEQNLDIEAIATTKKLCDEPAMQAERHYIAALEAVTTVRVSDDRLLLRHGDRVHLRYRPTTPTPTT